MRRIAMLVLASALLVGCGGGSDSDKTETAPAATRSLPGGKEFSGKEVDETGCSVGALSVIEPKSVTAGQARGKLELRKALPGTCTRIYWARFTPDPSNKAPFEVTIQVDGESFDPQASEEDVPTMQAWTVGAHADVDSVIKFCLKSGGSSDCLDYDVTS